MPRQITFQVEVEGRDLFLAWRDKDHGQAATLRVPRSQAATLQAAIASACNDGGLESFQGILFGDLSVTVK